MQTSRPWGTNFWPKFEILTVLGAVFPHFRPNKGEIWHGGADLLHRAKFHVYRGNVRVAPLGGKPIFGPLSKNNTGMAALRLHPLTFFDPISTFAARGYWKFEGKCPHRGKMLISLSYLFVSRKQPKQKLKIHLETRTKSENFVKIG